MLTDIFSSFDANISSSIFLNLPVWFTASWLLLFLHFSFWTRKRRLFFLSLTPKTIIFDQVTRTQGFNIRGFSLFLTALFLTLIFINFIGLVPYAFRNRSHLVMTLSMALPIWLSLLISGWASNPSAAAAHLLPTGAPDALSPALILIETISIFLRPITLSVRLAANIGAGHIILGLIGSYLSAGLFTYPLGLKILVTIIEAGYFLFEIGICLIQAYVFCLLLSLYSDEHPN